MTSKISSGGISRRGALVAALGIGALSLVACHRDPAAAPIIRRHVDYQTRPNTVYLLDSWASRSLVVEQHGADRSEMDAMNVKLTLRNRTNSQLRVAARARVLGPNSESLEVSEWSEGFIDGRALGDFSILAKSQSATAYVVEVRILR